MIIRILGRCAFTAAVFASALGAVPAAAQGSSTPIFKPATSLILCQPGFVYRCNKYGCFCVKA